MTVAHRPGWGVVLTAATFAVSFVFSASVEVGRMEPGAALAISAVAAGAVSLSARRPVAALVAVGALAGALPLVGSTFPVMDLVAVAVAFQALLHADLPLWVVAAVCLVLLTRVDSWQRIANGRGLMEPGVPYPLVLTGLVMVLGLQSRRVRRQHEELLALRDADRRRAVSDERRRVARDLHDVVSCTRPRSVNCWRQVTRGSRRRWWTSTGVCARKSVNSSVTGSGSPRSRPATAWRCRPRWSPTSNGCASSGSGSG